MEIWENFANNIAHSSISQAMAESKKLEKKVSGLSRSVVEKEKYRDEAKKTLSRIEKDLLSSELTIEKINGLLRGCQFYSFRLEKSLLRKDGYKVVRPNGDLAEFGSLSEGEKTFLTFLYFYQSLSSVVEDDEENEIVAVIDDPISSLDYSIMYVVSSLLRDLLRCVRDGNHERVSQVVLLTHNPRFHNEVAFKVAEAGPQKVSFFTISKKSPEPNEIIIHANQNPIRSPYEMLWDQVKVAEDIKGKTPIWLPNILRRILESYFGVLGNEENLYDLGIEDLQPHESAIHRALVAWSHNGSHEIFSSEDFNYSEEPCELWLKSFQRLFDKSGHGAHYRMMMGH